MQLQKHTTCKAAVVGVEQQPGVRQLQIHVTDRTATECPEVAVSCSVMWGASLQLVAVAAYAASAAAEARQHASARLLGLGGQSCRGVQRGSVQRGH